VLEGDTECFKTLLSEDSVVSAVDEGGRNLMHLIAAGRMTEESRWYDLPRSVWQYAVSLDTTDCVLQWTQLQYAIKSEDWFVLNQLLENNFDRSGLHMIRQRADDPDYIGRITTEAATYSMFLLLEFLYSISVNINRGSFERFPSPCMLLYGIKTRQSSSCLSSTVRTATLDTALAKRPCSTLLLTAC
jgi:hypothetical protein